MRSIFIMVACVALFSGAVFAKEEKAGISANVPGQPTGPGGTLATPQSQPFDPSRFGIELPGGSADSSIVPDNAFGAFQRGLYLTAFQIALPRAERGDAAAQTLIAELYQRGLGIKRDTGQAAKWYAIAANAGNREAKFAYALKLLEGRNVPLDRERGLELMEQAAEEGHPIANFNMAQRIIQERPTGAGYRRALPYLEKAAEYRLADAFYSLARIHLDGLANGIQDVETGKRWLERAARAGIDTAQIDYAIILAGTGEPDDMKQARNWFQLAASGGNVIAQNRLAHMLAGGLGGEADPVAAAKWHILAKRAGRNDVVLDDYLRTLDSQTRGKALAEANSWPARG